MLTPHQLAQNWVTEPSDVTGGEYAFSANSSAHLVAYHAVVNRQTRPAEPAGGRRHPDTHDH
jgi:hypothetical protein